jgi:hypothetical protein
MAEPKPLASLSAGLLARKGAARPAMRRQLALGHDGHAGQHDDLGWNDMGYDVDPTFDAGTRHESGLSPMAGHVEPTHEPAAILPMPGVPAMDESFAAPEPAVVQQRRRVQALDAVHAAPAPVAASVAPRRSVRPRAEAGANGRFAFTLRLDGQRHLLLRLASAATNRSAQQILVALVDDYFANQPAVSAMAAQLSDTASGPAFSGENA